MRRSLTAIALAIGCLLVGAAVAWLIPRDAPDKPTAERYADAARLHRGTVAAPSVPRPESVLAGIPDGSVARDPEALAAPPDRLVIETINVDAKVVPMGLTPEGALDSPASPELVAWYEFIGTPGASGAAVMSGHLDYRNWGPAVFWDLRQLSPGDRIGVVLEDGHKVEYQVTSTRSYPLAEVPMAELVADDSGDSLTLITCAGAFVDGEYTHRLLVRAARL